MLDSSQFATFASYEYDSFARPSESTYPAVEVHAVLHLLPLISNDPFGLQI